MLNYFRPKAGRFGIAPILKAIRPGSNPFTNSSTVTITMPAYARRCRVETVSIVCNTVGASGSALTATLKKWDATASAFVNLTAAFDVTSLTTKVTTSIPLLSTLTDAQRIVQASDTLYVDLIAAGSVTTQPTELSISAECGALE